MYNIDFQTPLCVHFIGIGGISMSGIAEILLQRGFHVRGSDSQDSPLLRRLTGCGASIAIGQRASNIKEGTQLVVYSAAIKEDNPELMEARRLGIPVLTRAEILGQIMKNYQLPIAVAGTHGKTTTTSMISQILLDNGSDPTISVGGILKSIQGNIRVGRSQVFVTEACEYTNSFLQFHPKIGVILNIDADHLDYFKDLEDIRSSFLRFAKLLPPEGTLIINRDIDHFDEFVAELNCNIITYGFHRESMYRAEEISHDDHANSTYSLICNGEPLGCITLSVPGDHNVSNSLAAIALARLLSVPMDVTRESLAQFDGAGRRFEYKGNLKGITIIDDYAHHPTEIRATLAAARKCTHRKIWCVFQPHTYSRTKALLDEFAAALSAADAVILTDIYSAREKNTFQISSRDLLDRLQEQGTRAWHFSSFDEVERFLLNHCVHGDLLITMGAGDVVKIGENLLGQ